jgi:hypothetical protein
MKYQLTIIVLSETSKNFRGEEIAQPQTVKKAPHYFEKIIPQQIIFDEEKTKIWDNETVFQFKGYSPNILLVQATLELANIFTTEVLDLENEILEGCYKQIKQRGGNEEFSESYSFFAVSHYEGEPEKLIRENAAIIASLLKSETITLDPKEIEYTLSSQIKYAKNDLTIVDWDGAFLFDPQGDHKPIIELLTLANLQLLRHRLLDRQLDERLMKMARLVKKPARGFFMFKNKELKNDLKEIIKNRMTSILEFQILEKEIKLIGEWYSARLYDLAEKKFKIDEWRMTIKDKLKSLEDIYTIFMRNFAVSNRERAEWAQLIGFFILQIGWFALIILEFFYFTR